MNIVTSVHSQGEGPALVEVTFPKGIRYPGEGGRRQPMRNPRSEWKDLATEKAEALGADIGFKEVEGGLMVAFRTQDDCSQVLAAMESEWPQRLKEGLRYWVQSAFHRVKDGQEIDLRSYVENIVDGFGLSFEDVADLNDPNPYL